MSDADEPKRDDGPETERDHDQEAILARRGRFVARALGALSLSAAAAACSPPQPCLRFAPDSAVGDASDGAAQTDASTDSAQDSGPMPCLSPMLDAGISPDAAAADASADVPDVAPMPCLSPPLPDSGDPAADAGEDDAAPMPCLRIAPTDGG
jgi:hypothetical protein